jgi:hypothetical protein
MIGIFGAILAEGLHAHRLLDQWLDAGFVIVGLVRIGSCACRAAAPDASDPGPGSGRAFRWHRVLSVAPEKRRDVIFVHAG